MDRSAAVNKNHESFIQYMQHLGLASLLDFALIWSIDGCGLTGVQT